MNKNILNIIQSFDVEDTFLEIQRLGDGLINGTFKVLGEKQNYVLQRINQQVFPNPKAIMENMEYVAKHLKSKSYPKAILEPYATSNGNSYIIHNDEYWRLIPFIENTITYNNIDSAKQAFAGGEAFGTFLKYLNDVDVSKINTIIPDFHNGELRWMQFMKSLESDLANRKSSIQGLIDEIISLNSIYIEMNKLISSGQLPIRLTHNDTKITNILFDAQTNEVSAIVDWDTIMPNTILSDFGDMVRTFCNSANEDEVNLELVSFRLDYFEALFKGFNSSLSEILTKTEKENLANAGFWITYMQVIRFLTDYLNGDIYYTITYPSHNLDRAMNQFYFYKSMLSVRDRILSLIKRIVFC